MTYYEFPITRQYRIEREATETLLVACEHCPWSFTGFTPAALGQQRSHFKEHHPYTRPRNKGGRAEKRTFKDLNDAKDMSLG